MSCSERILPGTRATLACKSSYKLPLTNDPAYREITCLDDGLWDRRVFRCLPGIFVIYVIPIQRVKREKEIRRI